MVSKGLKVGDTFSDGGRTYEILSVYPNGNYVSKAIEPKKVETKGEETGNVEKRTRRKAGE